MFDTIGDYVHWCNNLLGLHGEDNLLPPVLVTVFGGVVALIALMGALIVLRGIVRVMAGLGKQFWLGLTEDRTTPPTKAPTE